MKRPHVICQRCWQEAHKHWMGHLLAYCSHFRVLVRRHWIDQPFTVERDTSPEAAAAIQLLAVSEISKRLAARGITAAEADEIMENVCGAKWHEAG